MRHLSILLGMIEIRQIRAEDADLLRSIRLSALESDPEVFGSTFAAEAQCSADHWANLARERAAGDPGTNFFAVDAADRPVGLIGAFREGSEGMAAITSMWVAPEARRRGVADRLVAAALDWADSVGASAVELWVTHGNNAAHQLYEKLGFVDTDDVKPLPSDPCRLEQRMRWRPVQSGVT